ncbi:MAG: zinc-binding dehydrogenase, partial [Candidatus Xenobia bacterium]
DLVEEIALQAGGSVDVAVDNVGSSSVIQTAYQITGPRGRVIMVGVTRHDDLITIDSMPLHFGKLLTGSFGGNTYPTEDIPRYMRMQTAGRFDLAPLISHTFSLEQINAAIDVVRNGMGHRVQIEMKSRD